MDLTALSFDQLAGNRGFKPPVIFHFKSSDRNKKINEKSRRFFLKQWFTNLLFLAPHLRSVYRDRDRLFQEATVFGCKRGKIRLFEKPHTQRRHTEYLCRTKRSRSTAFVALTKGWVRIHHHDIIIENPLGSLLIPNQSPHFFFHALAYNKSLVTMLLLNNGLHNICDWLWVPVGKVHSVEVGNF